MSRRTMIGALVALILIGGGIYLLTKDDETNKASTETSQNTSQQPTSAFAPAANENQPFSATITNDGKTQGTIKSDGKGNVSYSATQSGQTVRIVYTKDAYYYCNGSTCYKYSAPTDTGGASFDPANYQYTKEQLSGFSNNSTNKGRQSCPAGTCDVWSVTSGGVTSTIFVDTDTNRISQVESTVSGKTSKVVYDYRSVSVEVPANAQTAPTQ